MKKGKITETIYCYILDCPTVYVVFRPNAVQTHYNINS